MRPRDPKFKNWVRSRRPGTARLPFPLRNYF